ncbi:unnamed protein product [Rhodiola kirilowii]
MEFRPWWIGISGVTKTVVPPLESVKILLQTRRAEFQSIRLFWFLQEDLSCQQLHSLSLSPCQLILVSV